MKKSNIYSSSLDSSDGGDTELSASPALETETDKEAEEQKSQNKTDDLPDVIGE